MEYEKKKRVRNNSKVFGLSKWVLDFPFTRMGKTRQGVHDTGWEFRVGYDQFRHPRENIKLAVGFMSLELRGAAGDVKFGDPNLASTSVLIVFKATRSSWKSECSQGRKEI